MDGCANIRDSAEEFLKDPSQAASYLNEALNVGDTSEFLRALRDVIEVSAGGMTSLAQILKLRVEHVELILSARSNPDLTGIDAVLDALGFTFAIQAKK